MFHPMCKMWAPIVVCVAVVLNSLASFAATPENEAPRLKVPTFQDLMHPGMFVEPQFGMEIESATGTEHAFQIQTTGAIIGVNFTDGNITFDQRIGHERRVAVLKFGRALKGAQITHNGPGFVRITVDQPNMTIRVNGDSLLFLHAHESTAIEIDRTIAVAWNSSWKNNHLVVDEWGGFATYNSNSDVQDNFDPAQKTVISYDIPADSVQCIGVCPPRAYKWEQSISDQIMHHWSDKPEEAYPPTNMLQAWTGGGNILLLQGERALWKDWQRDFTPSRGEPEFTRVRDECHKFGTKMIVYASPFYFLGGMDKQDGEFVLDGANIQFFLEAIRAVMRDYKPDGLYMDGQYFENPAALYALARQSREIVGETGILEWHSTGALGGGHSHCYMPHADAYIDFQLRGEGEKALIGNRDFLRFFVSAYNISNCIGALAVSYQGYLMPPSAIDPILRSNVRLHTTSDVAFGVKPSSDPETMWRTDANQSARVHITPAYIRYWAGLSDTLQARVDRDVDEHQAALMKNQTAPQAQE